MMDYNRLGIIKEDCLQFRNAVVDTLAESGILNTSKGQALSKKADAFFNATCANLDRFQEGETMAVPNSLRAARLTVGYLRTRIEAQANQAKIPSEAIERLDELYKKAMADLGHPIEENDDK